MIHRCHWEEIERVHAPPSTRAVEVQQISIGQLDRFVFGVTTIILRCSKCGKLKMFTVLGDGCKPRPGGE